MKFDHLGNLELVAEPWKLSLGGKNIVQKQTAGLVRWECETIHLLGPGANYVQ